MNPTTRKPLPIRVDTLVYVDAWQISDLRDTVLFMTDGSYIEGVNPVAVNRALLGVSQLGGDFPKFRTYGEGVWLVVQSVRTLKMPATPQQRGFVEMASGNAYDLPWTFSRDLFDSWAANSQHGMVHGNH